MTFIRDKTWSLTMTCALSSDVKNKPLNLSKVQVKLFFHSLDKNENVDEKVNLVDIIAPTISSKGS